MPKVYTRTGDDGSTALFGGSRVPKTHPRIDAYGTVDEANAALGVARAALQEAPEHDGVRALLEQIQSDLFVLGGDLASPGEQKYPVPRIATHHVEALEKEIDRLNEDLPELKHFILPGGTPAAAAVHLARTVVRRAERRTIEAAEVGEDISVAIRHYLNRLSDLLFTLARWLNVVHSIEEAEWRPVSRTDAA